MNEYKSNSDKAKNISEEKKIERVASGSIEKKKKSALGKMADLFLAQNPDDAYDDIVRDIVIPAIKQIFLDSLTTLLNGRTSKSGGKGISAHRVSYRDFYDKEERLDNYRYSGRSTNTLDYDNVIFESLGDAELVLDSIEEAIDKYGMVSVADYYDLSGVEVSTRDYPAHKYGWKDISGSRAVRTKDGWILKLPRVYPIC